MKHIKSFKESVKSDILADEIVDLIDNIDDSLSIDDFTDSVSKILINQYGTHNYDRFMDRLKNNLK